MTCNYSFRCNAASRRNSSWLSDILVRVSPLLGEGVLVVRRDPLNYMKAADIAHLRFVPAAPFIKEIEEAWKSRLYYLLSAVHYEVPVPPLCPLLGP